MEIRIFGSRYDVTAASITGRRKENQDAFGWIAFTESGIVGSATYDEMSEGAEMLVAVVCDGMGGMPDGKAASELVTLRTMEWARTINRTDLAHVLENYLKEALPDIEKDLIETYPGSGTTLAMLLGMGDEWVTIHLGDSRIYTISMDGEEFRTEDHAPVEEMRKAGYITEDEMEDHPMKNLISRFVGGDDADTAEINRISDWKSAVLCSDGAYGCMPRTDFFRLISTEDADGMVQSCFDAGSSDNITSIVIKRNS